MRGLLRRLDAGGVLAKCVPRQGNGRDYKKKTKGRDGQGVYASASDAQRRQEAQPGIRHVLCTIMVAVATVFIWTVDSTNVGSAFASQVLSNHRPLWKSSGCRRRWCLSLASDLWNVWSQTWQVDSLDSPRCLFRSCRSRLVFRQRPVYSLEQKEHWMTSGGVGLEEMGTAVTVGGTAPWLLLRVDAMRG